MYRMKEPLVLASGSPRRKELLEGLGVSIEIAVSGIDEMLNEHESTQALVERLALAKATQVAKSHPQRWVLGADTDVEIDGVVLGKPCGEADAARMLALIQGRRHVVWGGFALVNIDKGIQHIESHQSFVEIRELSEMEIRAYVSTGEPLDKAGAYAIQGVGAGLVASVGGSYTNVVGLNLSAVLQALKLYEVVLIS